MKNILDRWFRLTANEHLLIVIMVGVLSLGLVMRWLHFRNLDEAPPVPAEIEAIDERF